MKAVLFVVIVAVAFLAGCSGGGLPQGMKDCGTITSQSNDDPAIVCFNEAAANCSAARLRMDTSDIQQMASAFNPSITMTIEVQGGTPEACKLYERIDDIKPPETMSAEQKQMFNSLAQPVKGKDITCAMPADRIRLFVTSMPPLSNAEVCEKCSGSLLDYMRSTGGCPGTDMVRDAAQKIYLANCKMAATACQTSHMLNPGDKCSYCETSCIDSSTGVDLLNPFYAGTGPGPAVAACKKGNSSAIPSP
jgi:hypothetical protein